MRIFLFSLMVAVGFSSAAPASPAVSLSVRLGGVAEGAAIPPRFAFCQADVAKRSIDGGNISPEISWSKGPEGTKSYVILMHDPDVPTVFDDANQEGKIIPAELKRMDFTHWVLVDIAPSVTRLPEGADADRVVKDGKRTQRTTYGLRGLNDYGSFMKGEFYGYDGPCPPWNDARMHHYIFTIYALSVPSLELSGAFSRRDVLAAMNGKILAQGSATGTYTQNPDLLKAAAIAQEKDAATAPLPVVPAAEGAVGD